MSSRRHVSRVGAIRCTRFRPGGIPGRIAGESGRGRRTERATRTVSCVPRDDRNLRASRNLGFFMRSTFSGDTCVLQRGTGPPSSRHSPAESVKLHKLPDDGWEQVRALLEVALDTWSEGEIREGAAARFFHNENGGRCPRGVDVDAGRRWGRRAGRGWSWSISSEVDSIIASGSSSFEMDRHPIAVPFRGGREIRRPSRR